MTRKNWITVVALLFLVALPAAMLARSARSQNPQETPPERSDKPEKQSTQTLKIDVDLVLVNATVTDGLNRYVSGLEGNHFQIWEDKVEQKVEYFSDEDVPI